MTSVTSEAGTVVFWLCRQDRRRGQLWSSLPVGQMPAVPGWPRPSVPVLPDRHRLWLRLLRHRGGRDHRGRGWLGPVLALHRVLLHDGGLDALGDVVRDIRFGVDLGQALQVVDLLVPFVLFLETLTAEVALPRRGLVPQAATGAFLEAAFFLHPLSKLKTYF